MTCDAMLELMLEADLEALDGRGDSPVAMHVRECSRCRAMAEQLVADTSMLAEMVATRGAAEVARGPELVHGAGMRTRRRVPHGRYLLVGSLAAAALALVVVRPGADDRVQPAVRAVTVPSATAPSSVEHRGGAPDASSVPAHPAHPDVRPSSPPLVRSALRPFPPAQGVAATPFASPTVEQEEVAMTDARAVVSVDPPPGKRVAVIGTRNPALTVVWLY